MVGSTDLHHKLGRVFDQQQADVLAEVITAACQDLVKTSDFNELNAIVKELAEAQKGTEARVDFDGISRVSGSAPHATGA